MSFRCTPHGSRLLLSLGWAGVVLAPFVTHAAIATGRFTVAAAALAAIEVVTLAIMALRHSRGMMRAGGIAVAATLLGLLAARLALPDALGETGLLAAAGASHAVIYVSLLFLFARTLQRGQTPLITTVAQRLRGELPPPIRAYTRTATEAWCGFFALQLLVSAGLAAAAPQAVWSLFINVLDGPLVLTMFATEYLIRRLRFRDHDHVSLAETFRGYATGRANAGNG